MHALDGLEQPNALPERYRRTEPVARSWQEDVINEIHAAGVRAEAVTDKTRKKQFHQYLADPTACQRAYARSLERWRSFKTTVWCISVSGTICFVAGVVIALSDGRAHYAPLSGRIGIITGFFAVVVAFIVFAMHDFSPSKHSALSFLQKSQDAYLPSIHHRQTPEGIVVSLEEQRIDGKHRYAWRAFGVNETAAALEYQVELEAIIEEVEPVRREAYLRACLQPAALALSAGNTKQLGLELPADENMLKDLQVTLESQRKPLSLA